MDNHYEELMHFVGNNVDEIICRNWANDIRRMEKAERQRDQLREALEMCLKSMETGLVDYNPFDEAAMQKARAALKATEEG